MMKWILLLLISVNTYAGDWTIHTVTTHVGLPGLESVTPGIAYEQSGYRFGYLNNSYNIDSLYAAKLYHINPAMRLGLGFISGYEWKEGAVVGSRNGVVPLMALEVDITDNVSVLWFGQAFNLEIKL